jgi:peptidoglycan/LPS O-acetylase OafA/YrhL
MNSSSALDAHATDVRPATRPAARKEHRNFGLDVVRAAAILLVIFSHYLASTPLTNGGLPGVEMFFVLSGFLIGNILIRSFQGHGTTFQTLRDFWLKRWFRTLPNYYVFLAFHCVITLWLAPPLESRWPLYPIFLQNFDRPMPGFFSESWSLAIEEWFYLLFPLLVVIVNPGRQLRHGALFAITALFLLVPPVIRGWVGGETDLQTLRLIVLPHLDTMMYGVIAAMLMNWQSDFWNRLARPLMLLPALAFFAAGLALVHVPGRSSAVLVFPLIAVGVALSLPYLHRVRAEGRLVPGVVRYVSKVSYSAYLLHMPIFFFVDSHVAWDQTSVAVKLAGRLGMVLAALLLSYIPYRLIELPFLHLRDRVLR